MQTLLNRIINNFIKNQIKNNLSDSQKDNFITSGNLNLKNLVINHSELNGLLNQFQVPFRITYMQIESIKSVVNIKSLLKLLLKDPLTLSIKGVVLKITPQKFTSDDLDQFQNMMDLSANSSFSEINQVNQAIDDNKISFDDNFLWLQQIHTKVENIQVILDLNNTPFSECSFPQKLINITNIDHGFTDDDFEYKNQDKKKKDIQQKLRFESVGVFNLNVDFFKQQLDDIEFEKQLLSKEGLKEEGINEAGFPLILYELLDLFQLVFRQGEELDAVTSSSSFPLLQKYSRLDYIYNQVQFNAHSLSHQIDIEGKITIYHKDNYNYKNKKAKYNLLLDIDHLKIQLNTEELINLMKLFNQMGISQNEQLVYHELRNYLTIEKYKIHDVDDEQFDESINEEKTVYYDEELSPKDKFIRFSKSISNYQSNKKILNKLKQSVGNIKSSVSLINSLLNDLQDQKEFVKLGKEDFISKTHDKIESQFKSDLNIQDQIKSICGGVNLYSEEDIENFVDLAVTHMTKKFITRQHSTGIMSYFSTLQNIKDLFDLKSLSLSILSRHVEVKLTYMEHKYCVKLQDCFINLFKSGIEFSYQLEWGINNIEVSQINGEEERPILQTKYQMSKTISVIAHNQESKFFTHAAKTIHEFMRLRVKQSAISRKVKFQFYLKNEDILVTKDDIERLHEIIHFIQKEINDLNANSTNTKNLNKKSTKKLNDDLEQEEIDDQTQFENQLKDLGNINVQDKIQEILENSFLIFEQYDINMNLGRLLIENNIEIDKSYQMIMDVGHLTIRNLKNLPLKYNNIDQKINGIEFNLNYQKNYLSINESLNDQSYDLLNIENLNLQIYWAQEDLGQIAIQMGADIVDLNVVISTILDLFKNLLNISASHKIQQKIKENAMFNIMNQTEVDIIRAFDTSEDSINLNQRKAKVDVNKHLVNKNTIPNPNATDNLLLKEDYQMQFEDEYLHLDEVKANIEVKLQENQIMQDPLKDEFDDIQSNSTSFQSFKFSSQNEQINIELQDLLLEKGTGNNKIFLNTKFKKINIKVGGQYQSRFTAEIDNLNLNFNLAMIKDFIIDLNLNSINAQHLIDETYHDFLNIKSFNFYYCFDSDNKFKVKSQIENFNLDIKYIKIHSEMLYCIDSFINLTRFLSSLINEEQKIENEILESTINQNKDKRFLQELSQDQKQIDKIKQQLSMIQADFSIKNQNLNLYRDESTIDYQKFLTITMTNLQISQNFYFNFSFNQLKVRSINSLLLELKPIKNHKKAYFSQYYYDIKENKLKGSNFIGDVNFEFDQDNLETLNSIIRMNKEVLNYVRKNQYQIQIFLISPTDVIYPTPSFNQQISNLQSIIKLRQLVLTSQIKKTSIFLDFDSLNLSTKQLQFTIEYLSSKSKINIYPLKFNVSDKLELEIDQIMMLHSLEEESELNIKNIFNIGSALMSDFSVAASLVDDVVSNFQPKEASTISVNEKSMNLSVSISRQNCLVQNQLMSFEEESNECNMFYLKLNDFQLGQNVPNFHISLGTLIIEEYQSAQDIVGVEGLTLDFTQHCLNLGVGGVLGNLHLGMFELGLKVAEVGLRWQSYFQQSELCALLNQPSQPATVGHKYQSKLWDVQLLHMRIESLELKVMRPQGMSKTHINHNRLNNQSDFLDYIYTSMLAKVKGFLFQFELKESVSSLNDFSNILSLLKHYSIQVESVGLFNFFIPHEEEYMTHYLRFIKEEELTRLEQILEQAQVSCTQTDGTGQHKVEVSNELEVHINLNSILFICDLRRCFEQRTREQSKLMKNKMMQAGQVEAKLPLAQIQTLFFSQLFSFQTHEIRINLFDSYSSSGSMPLLVTAFSCTSKSEKGIIDTQVKNWFIQYKNLELLKYEYFLQPTHVLLRAEYADKTLKVTTTLGEIHLIFSVNFLQAILYYGSHLSHILSIEQLINIETENEKNSLVDSKRNSIIEFIESNFSNNLNNQNKINEMNFGQELEKINSNKSNKSKKSVRINPNSEIIDNSPSLSNKNKRINRRDSNKIVVDFDTAKLNSINNNQYQHIFSEYAYSIENNLGVNLNLKISYDDQSYDAQLQNNSTKDVYFKKIGHAKQIFSPDGFIRSNEQEYNKPNITFQIQKNNEKDNKWYLISKNKVYKTGQNLFYTNTKQFGLKNIIQIKSPIIIHNSLSNDLNLEFLQSDSLNKSQKESIQVKKDSQLTLPQQLQNWVSVLTFIKSGLGRESKNLDKIVDRNENKVLVQRPDDKTPITVYKFSSSDYSSAFIVKCNFTQNNLAEFDQTLEFKPQVIFTNELPFNFQYQFYLRNRSKIVSEIQPFKEVLINNVYPSDQAVTFWFSLFGFSKEVSLDLYSILKEDSGENNTCIMQNGINQVMKGECNVPTQIHVEIERQNQVQHRMLLKHYFNADGQVTISILSPYIICNSTSLPLQMHVNEHEYQLRYNLKKQGNIEEKEEEDSSEDFAEDYSNQGIVDVSALLQVKKVSQLVSMRRSMLTKTYGSATMHQLPTTTDSQDILMWVPRGQPENRDSITFSIKNSEVKSAPVPLVSAKKGEFDLEFSNSDLSFEHKQSMECRQNQNLAFFATNTPACRETFDIITVAPRYCIINSTDQDISVFDVSLLQNQESVVPGDIKQFHFFKGDAFYLKVKECRTGGISMAKIKDQLNVAVSDSKSIRHLVKLNCKLELPLNMVTLVISEIDFTPFVIENKTQQKLHVVENFSQQEVKPHTTFNFAYTGNVGDRHLKLQLSSQHEIPFQLFKNDSEARTTVGYYDIEQNKIFNFQKTIDIGEEKVELVLTMQHNRSRQVMLWQKNEQDQDQNYKMQQVKTRAWEELTSKTDDEEVRYSFMLDAKQVGCSVVNKNNKEVAQAVAKGLSGEATLRNAFKGSVRLKSMKVDNMSEDCHFPLVAQCGWIFTGEQCVDWNCSLDWDTGTRSSFQQVSSKLSLGTLFLNTDGSILREGIALLEDLLPLGAQLEALLGGGVAEVKNAECCLSRMETLSAYWKVQSKEQVQRLLRSLEDDIQVKEFDFARVKVVFNAGAFGKTDQVKSRLARYLVNTLVQVNDFSLTIDRFFIVADYFNTNRLVLHQVRYVCDELLRTDNIQSLVVSSSLLVHKKQFELVKHALESKLGYNSAADLDIILSCSLLEFLNKVSCLIENEGTLRKVQQSVKDVLKVSYLNIKNQFKSHGHMNKERQPLFTDQLGVLLRYDPKVPAAQIAQENIVIKKFKQGADGIQAKYMIEANYFTQIFTNQCIQYITSHYGLNQRLQKINQDSIESLNFDLDSSIDVYGVILIRQRNNNKLENINIQLPTIREQGFIRENILQQIKNQGCVDIN